MFNPYRISLFLQKQMDIRRKEFKLLSKYRKLSKLPKENLRYLEIDLAQVFSKKGGVGKMDHLIQMRKNRNQIKLGSMLRKLRNNSVDTGIKTKTKIPITVLRRNNHAIQDSLTREIISQIHKDKVDLKDLTTKLQLPIDHIRNGWISLVTFVVTIRTTLIPKRKISSHAIMDTLPRQIIKQINKGKWSLPAHIFLLKAMERKLYLIQVIYHTKKEWINMGQLLTNLEYKTIRATILHIAIHNKVTNNTTIHSKAIDSLNHQVGSLKQHNQVRVQDIRLLDKKNLSTRPSEAVIRNWLSW